MARLKFVRWMVLPLILMIFTSTSRADVPPQVTVRIAPEISGKFSGRILIFAQPASEVRRVGPYVFLTPSLSAPKDIWVKSIAVEDLDSSRPITVNLDDGGFPSDSPAARSDKIYLQAILDIGGDYGVRKNLGDGDLFSFGGAVEVVPSASHLDLTLDRVFPARSPWPGLENLAEGQAVNSLTKQVYAQTRQIDLHSDLVTRAIGRDASIQGWVLLPPAYDPNERYPVVFQFGAFGVGLNDLTGVNYATTAHQHMARGQAPHMIWVFLDHTAAYGTHEFADSATNGPWEAAFVKELLPYIQRNYAVDRTPEATFLTGHSSGGWAALWLLVRNPNLFAGAWVTAPDPVSFHDFQNVDLYSANNAYYRDDGSEIPAIRTSKGDVPFRDFAQFENELGRTGQLAAFEAVFSPSEHGVFKPLFDRVSGKIDRDVANYWIRNFDIASLIVRQPGLDAALRGKIHIVIGDQDTFYLEGSVKAFQRVLKGTRVEPDIRIIPGRNHFDLYSTEGDPRRLSKQFAWDMYRHAKAALSVAPAPTEMRR